MFIYSKPRKKVKIEQKAKRYVAFAVSTCVLKALLLVNKVFFPIFACLLFKWLMFVLFLFSYAFSLNRYYCYWYP